jgi:acetyl-CoA acyltransferase
MSDGAAFVLVMSEEMVKELNLEPIARLVNFASAGVEPRIMGIGPVKAVPKVLKQAGLSINDIGLIELNEAFASQSLAVIRELGLNPDIVNVVVQSLWDTHWDVLELNYLFNYSMK